MELRRKVSQAESRAQELSNELQDYESRRKEQHSSSSSSSTSALRDSENRYHVEEKLKGELNRLRHQVCYIYSCMHIAYDIVYVYSIA